MAPRLTLGMFTAAHAERLAAACDVADPEPLAHFDDARAVRLLADADVMLSAWGCPPLDEAVLGRAPRLRMLAHAAGTVKNHVTPACFRHGVRVSSAAQANAVPVAEFTVAAIVLANKRAFRLARSYAEKRAFRFWPEEVPDPGNWRKTVGVVGASRIGRLVLEGLRGFDFERLVTDPFLSAEDARSLHATLVPLPELLERSDVVTLHAPALPETRHLLDAEGLARMGDGAVLVNTARGHLVDHAALTRELVAGRLDAVLDTTDPELLPEDSPLYDLPNVFLTPHIAGALARERERLVDLALGEIERFARGEPLLHEVREADWGHIA